MQLPSDYNALYKYWETNAPSIIERYQHGREWSFIPGLMPEEALKMRTSTLIDLLKMRLDFPLKDALNPTQTIPSPIQNLCDTQWIKTANMVGINVRTIGSFWNIIRYALTLPDSQKAIHILPIWEPGVAASLYGMSSWNINQEFYSEELALLFPHLNTVEAQLKVVINILHGLGKVVGMDVIPHCDRYAEIVLANPSYFEWLQRSGNQIIKHEEHLHKEVEEEIFAFIDLFGQADKLLPKVLSKEVLFSPDFTEEKRLRILFGSKEDKRQRGQRRNQLIQHLYEKGLEPLPATMAPPYRELEVDEDPKAMTIDMDGRIWRDYKIVAPQEMSRVFGPLTRYKLYNRWNDNEDWEIDFSNPRPIVWEYVYSKYNEVQAVYNFDFMRGDMSHVQMRPDGVPLEPVKYYDIHQYISTEIQKVKPYFAYFAESFLAPPNVMAYGDEADHLDYSNADSTLGDLQSMIVGSPIFIQSLHRYTDLAKTRHFTPSLTMMTADKDDPRFDAFYIKGNELRLFLGLFITDMPSYMALGFETRDTHLRPAPNEHYTKLYVFHFHIGSKATRGSFTWGKNAALFAQITRLRLYAEQILPKIENQSIRWLLPPDATGHHKVIAWTMANEPKYIFIVNLDIDEIVEAVKIPCTDLVKEGMDITFDFSTIKSPKVNALIVLNNFGISLKKILPSECLVYKLEKRAS